MSPNQMEKATAVSDTRRVADDTVPIRMRQLFGRAGLTERLMAALGRGHTSVEDIIAGRNVPHEVVWILECLERIHIARWPKRWKDARGPDAPPHSPLVHNGPLVWTAQALAPARDVLLSGGAGRAAGDAIGISPQHVYKLISEGRLPRPAKRERPGRPVQTQARPKKN